MYEAMVGTSGLVVVAEEDKKPKAKAKKVEPKEENIEEAIEEDNSEEVVEEAIEEDNSEEGIDLSDIDLEAQDKKTLVEIANSLEIETKGLNAKQIIEKIKATK
jgi:hypothetical protein